MQVHADMPRVPGVRVWLVLWRAAHAIERHARRSVEDLDLGYSDFAVLEALLHKGPLPVNTIGTKVLLSSGSITTAVDRLETRGLVERRVDPHDRRARVVHLTPEGETLIEAAFAEHEVALDRATAALDSEERRTLVRLLLKLGRAAAASPLPSGCRVTGPDAHPRDQGAPS